MGKPSLYFVNCEHVNKRLLLGCVHGPITSLIAASMYAWVLPTELTSMNALANIGGGMGLACSGVLAGLLIDAGYSWETVYYVDTFLMKQI